VWAAFAVFWTLTPTWASAAISQAMKNASDAEVYRPTISAFVALQIPKLIGDDADAQKAARMTLIDQVGSNPPPGASFMDVYADVLNQAMEPVANSKSIRARLNLAVVNAEVATRANNARQASVTKIFLLDSAAPVAMWGMKAAKFELLPQMREPAILRKPDLIAAILQSVKNHPDDGLVVDDAYLALTLKDTDPALHSVGDPVIQELVPQVLSLLTYRASQYATDPPPAPTADEGALFLTRLKVWKLETPAQQAQTMKLMLDVVSAVTKLLDAADQDTRADLMDLLRKFGRGFSILGGFVQSDPLQKAATDLYNISSDVKSDVLSQRIDALSAAIQDLGQTSGGTQAPPP
jgi:hypothetical protein